MYKFFIMLKHMFIILRKKKGLLFIQAIYSPSKN